MSALNFVVHLTIEHPIERRSVTMILQRLIQFTPSKHMTMVFHNDNDEELEIELSAPRFIFSDGHFVEYITDETAVEYFRDGGKEVGAKMQETIDWYKTFGFVQVENRQILAVTVTA